MANSGSARNVAPAHAGTYTHLGRAAVDTPADLMTSHPRVMGMDVLITGADTDLGRVVAEGFGADGHRLHLTGADADAPGRQHVTCRPRLSYATPPIRPALRRPSPEFRTTSMPSSSFRGRRDRR